LGRKNWKGLAVAPIGTELASRSQSVKRFSEVSAERKDAQAITPLTLPGNISIVANRTAKELSGKSEDLGRAELFFEQRTRRSCFFGFIIGQNGRYGSSNEVATNLRVFPEAHCDHGMEFKEVFLKKLC